MFERGKWYTPDGARAYKAANESVLIDLNRSLPDERDPNVFYGIALVRQNDGRFVERHYTRRYGVTTFLPALDKDLGKMEFQETEVVKTIIKLEWK